MKLNLTGGVLFTLLCDIKKEKISARETRQGNTDPTSELEMMLCLWEIVQGHKFTLNKESLRTKLTNYKNCDCNGNTLIPLEAKFDDEGEALNAGNYLFNEEATKRRIDIFIHTFIDSQNTTAITAFVNTVNEVLYSDGLVFEHNSGNGFLASIINNETVSVFLSEYLYNVFYLVITSHSDNTRGKDTLSFIKKEDYSPCKSNMEVKIDAISAAVIKQYIKDLEEPINARDGWDEYIETLKKEFSKVKIYYDPDREYSFRDIYIPSSVSSLDPYALKSEHEIEFKIEVPTTKVIAEYSRSVLISGVGGLGKTMLLRHLLLDAIENDKGYVPIFVSVRNYTDEHKDFVGFIHDQCKQYYPQLEKDKLLKTITSQQCILFLDGFDEIPFEYLQSFIRLYNQFIRIDFGNIIMMSSRPVGGATPNHFTKIFICPFEPQQSYQLVDKLTSIQHNPVLGEKFKKELKTKLFNSHKDFTGNPLLLTLMLRIYEQNASIPNDRFDFYYNAYEVLAHKHDALKEDGGFSRKYKTGLTPTDFANCFKEFCAYSLLLDGKMSFSESEMLKYYDLIKIKREKQWNFELKDFVYDATASTGLMYLQGNKYIFIHRSLQEFFCAWFLSTQEDTLLYNIALQLQKHGKGLIGETLELLDERIHYKMEKYVYLRYFDSIFNGCDEENKYDECYKKFLCRFYNRIMYHYSSGTVSYWYQVVPSEAIYTYCMETRCASIADTDLGFPEYDAFQEDEIYEFYDNNEITAGSEADIPCDYDTDTYGEPEMVGHNYRFTMSKVLAEPNKYKEIIDIIFSDSFPLKTEYDIAYEYWTELREKYKEEGNNNINLLDLLH